MDYFIFIFSLVIVLTVPAIGQKIKELNRLYVNLLFNKQCCNVMVLGQDIRQFIKWQSYFVTKN